MKYSKGRNKPPFIPVDDLEKSLKIITNLFKEEWLNNDDNHPLQILWKREDPLATIELHTFGSSILSIINMNTKWVEDNIREIKNGNMGFVFEIILASMINNGENQDLILPPLDNPGYDLTIQFRDDSKINISCKNYGLSDRNKLFIKNAEDVEKSYLRFCKKYNKNKIQCYIINIAKRYAEDRDWDNLKSHLEYVIAGFDGKEVHCVIEETWFITLLPVEEREKISENYLTYNFFIITPFHEYDKSYLYSKFEDACDNLDEHGVEQTDDEINIIFVHLPENASISACIKWAEDYLDEHPEKQVSGIFFIQNVVATNIEEKKSFISIGVKHVNNDYYSSWLNKNSTERLINLEAVVAGEISEDTPTYKFFRGSEEIDMSDLEADNFYLYQRGKHYIEITSIEEEKISRMEEIGPGIHKYLIFRFENEGILLKPKFPPDDKLILI